MEGLIFDWRNDVAHVTGVAQGMFFFGKPAARRQGSEWTCLCSHASQPFWVFVHRNPLYVPEARRTLYILHFRGRECTSFL
jgi:hypothetical protein